MTALSHHPRSLRPRPNPSLLPPTVPVRRSTLIGLAVAGAVLTAWTAGATILVLSRDDIAQRVFVRETEMKLGYEDKIGRLSGHLEREITQNLVERNAVTARLDALAARQAEIEARQSWLRKAAERVGSAPAGGNGASADPLPPARPVTSESRPAPLPDDLSLRNSEGAAIEKPVPRDRLSLLEDAARQVAAEEMAMVASLGRAARTRASRLRSAIDATGVDLKRERAASAMGGPLVALPEGARAGQVGFMLTDLDLSFAELARLQSAARSLPLAAPLAGELEQTSPFGYRLDPFTRGPALHTGLDFRAEQGTPARATAAGRVVSAEYAGGYGLMVEIDHGGGVSTRYGHLSGFAVVPGQRVEAGQTVGRTGSTGRSTGAHLHYETRVNGEAVNPIRFLEAGRLIRRTDG